MKRVLLIVMPFAEVTYPSLALGLFKARFQDEGIPCHVEYLNILFAEMTGLADYSAVGRVTSLFAGEQMFARVLFAHCIPDDNQYHAEFMSKVPLDIQCSLQRMKIRVIPFLQTCLEIIPWATYDFIGFTSLFEQNIPSLALAYQVKRYYPEKTIVFGGANCESTMGITMHKCFPFIDYICSGEADETFPELIKRLIDKRSVLDLPGIIYRDNGQSNYTGKAPKIQNLGSLPFPNYDDYFRRVRNSTLVPWISPFLLMETSRGCWWGEKRKCTFCGLNSGNLTFRSKNSARIIEEILYLTQRYGIPFVRATDNVLNLEHFDDLFPRIIQDKLNVQLYFEVRPSLGKHQIRMLAQSGVVYLQAGIESLSTHVLKLMRKGTSTLRNIQFLKWCKQLGINADWNIIFGFPGEIPEDYARSFELASVITHLNPPSGFGRLRMDRFSHNFDCCDQVGFANLRPLRVYRYLYPFGSDTLFDMVYYFDFDYQDAIDDGGYLIPLTELVLRWKGKQSFLYSQCYDDRLTIYDSRPVATSPDIVLRGIRGHIYEYCDEMRSVKQIRQWLNDSHNMEVSENEIKTILEEFTGMKVMVSEKDMYLSLAIMTYDADF